MSNITIFYNYTIHSLDLSWTKPFTQNIGISILDINKNFIKEYLKSYNPFSKENLHDQLFNFTNINQMIETKDITCEIEAFIIDTNRDGLEIGYANNFYTGKTSNFEEDVYKGLVYKTYVTDASYDVIDEYYGFTIPDRIPYSYLDALRISSNDPIYNIGQVVKFRFNNGIITGVIIKYIDGEQYPKMPFNTYYIAEINPNNDGKYSVYWDDSQIYTDDIIEATNSYNYNVLYDVVVNENTTDFDMHFDQSYKDYVCTIMNI